MKAKTKTQALGPLQRKWIAALESGKFKQAKGRLFDGKGYCCLGVACVVMGEKPTDYSGDYLFLGEMENLPPKIAKSLRLRTRSGDANKLTMGFRLTELNDESSLSLEEIGGMLRALPHRYFKGPA